MSRRRLSVRTENAAADLLRRVAEGIRRGGAGRGIDPQRGAHRTVANGRTDRRRMGGYLPGSVVVPGAVLLVVVVGSRPTVGHRLSVTPARRGLLRRAGIRFEYRPARSAQLCGILPKAHDDPVAVRYLFAAEPENVGGAGQLLFQRSPVFLRKSRILNGDAAGHPYRKTQNNSVRSHVRSFFRIHRACMFGVTNCSTRGLKINGAGEGSHRTTKCEGGPLFYATLPPCRSSSPPRSGAWADRKSKTRQAPALLDILRFRTFLTFPPLLDRQIHFGRFVADQVPAQIAPYNLVFVPL
jgi:hypothetical protein